MSDKLDEYTDALNRLVPETVACTPQEWTRGTLTIQSDGTRINYQLKNEAQPGTAVISEKLAPCMRVTLQRRRVDLARIQIYGPHPTVMRGLSIFQTTTLMRLTGGKYSGLL